MRFRAGPSDFDIKTLVIITWAWNSFEVRRMHLTINTVFFFLVSKRG